MLHIFIVTPTIKYEGTVVPVKLHIFVVIPTIKYKGTVVSVMLHIFIVTHTIKHCHVTYIYGYTYYKI